MANIYAWATQFTRESWFEGKKNPSRNMLNRKPFRTKAQKVAARDEACRCDDGAWRSSAPVSYHEAPRRSGTPS